MDDFDAFHEMWTQPQVVRHITGSPLTRREAWSRFLRNVGHWAAMGYGYWAVAEADSDRFIGDVGFLNLQREIYQGEVLGEFALAPEAGWSLHPSVHGTGLATEAMGAALRWADERYPFTICTITTENRPSVTLASRLGYVPVQDVPWGDGEATVYRRSNPSGLERAL